MTTPDTPAGRGISALATALADLTADAVEGCTLEQVYLYGTYTDGRSGYAGNLRRTVTPDDLGAVLAVFAENKRLTNALELLHARILRDLPNDGSELPQPEDPWWATRLDGIVTYAAEVYATAIRSQR
jgi:hypothetical protein